MNSNINGKIGGEITRNIAFNSSVQFPFRCFQSIWSM
jgi:hypothetical protein